ncbi:c-type cytochrome [Polaribacter aestuariivivens]|nr:cytochrome c [Polaribacter aestuariivivens]
MKFRVPFLILILGVFFASCIANVEEQLEETDPGVNTKVSYKNSVKPIIDGRCVSCHSSGGNFPELTSYAKVSANAAIVKDAVASGRMPRGGTLTTAQIKSIVDWVDEGALDN